MALLGINLHTFYRSRLRRLLCLCVLSLFLIISGCSSGDGPEDPGNNSPTFHYLGTGNANMPSDGNVMTQYDDAPVGSEISKLVDNNVSTSYITYHTGVELKWMGSKSVTVLSYALTSSSDSQKNDPRSWVFSGSSGNGSWVEIDVRKNEQFDGRNETKTYEITTEASFPYYRLLITANNGGSATQIAEWVIKEVPPIEIDENSIADLMGKSFNNTKSEATPMGKDHLNDKQVATAAELAWLADPTKQPDKFHPDDKFSWKNFPVDQNSGLYPYGSPKPADINQRSVGNCSLLAAMGFLAHYCPMYIKSIIEESSDNKTFIVTLYNPKGEQVKVGVDNLFIMGGEGNLGAVAGKGVSTVTWATVIEKAMMKWKQVYSSDIVSGASLGGIDTVYASAIITGNGSSFTFNPDSFLTGPELQRVVKVSIKEKKLLVGGFRWTGEDIPFDGKYKTVSAHAYSVFLPEPGTKYLFGMRNPWGSAATINNYDASKEDGLMYIPDDGRVPPTIDFRVVELGAAEEYFIDDAGPYRPPVYTRSSKNYVAEHLRTTESLLRLAR